MRLNKKEKHMRNRICKREEGREIGWAKENKLSDNDKPISVVEGGKQQKTNFRLFFLSQVSTQDGTETNTRSNRNQAMENGKRKRG